MRIVLPMPEMRPSTVALKESRSNAILRPARASTQRAVHSARDRGHDVVERRGHWRSFLSAVILTERSLDTVDDGFRNFAEIGVAGTVAVLEAGMRNVLEFVSHGTSPFQVRLRLMGHFSAFSTFDRRKPSPSAIVRCARTASRSFGYGRPASIATCTALTTSPASG